MPRNDLDSLSGSGDVPTFRGGPAHTGVNPGPGPDGPPAELWRVRTGAEVYAAPAVADGTVYLGSSDGFLYALDAATGEQAWRVRTRQGIYDTPTVAVDAVYAVSGGVRWRVDAEGIGAFTPAVVGDLVYVSGDGAMMAFDTSDGSERWRFELDNGLDVTSSAAVSDSTLYAGVGSGFSSGPGGLVALDAASCV